ncbi:hypothetical protein GMMP15_1730004 [Candidatus Magnetomoraceae bacterium gMMP-15]
MKTSLRGKIITFYSYKGGVGRSMILANIAWILASSGKRVLVIDWDLEAPGLHRYFSPFLKDKNLINTEGLIEFLTNFIDEAMTPVDQTDEDPNWYKPFANILHYAVSLNYDFPENGFIDFVPAGRQRSSYSNRVNLFDWQSFYDTFGGGTFLEAAKKKMRAEYDYILIDSRTGITDNSGICTIQMPDILAIFFTGNNQSIKGGANVAKSVSKQWIAGKKRYGERLIFPVLTRSDRTEKDKLDTTRNYVKKQFASFIQHIPETEQDNYWGDIEIPYIPWYAYEEILATFSDNPAQKDSLIAAIIRLITYLTNNEINIFIPPEKRKCDQVLSKFSRQIDKDFYSQSLVIPHNVPGVDPNFYIVRDADKNVLSAMERPRAIVTIHGPWQSGKSSLIKVHVAIQNKQDRIRAVIINFKTISNKEFQSLNTIWQAIASEIAEQLSLKTYDWNPDAGHDSNFSRFLAHSIFDDEDKPLLICFDEIERLFNLPIKSEFFSTVRAFYNKGATILNWKKVSWILATSLEPSLLIDNFNVSPFNIGLREKLDMFSQQEIKESASYHGLTLKPEDLDNIMEYIGGNPYLVNILFENLARNPESRDQFFNIQNASADRGIFQSHLNNRFELLQKNPKLIKEMKKIIKRQSSKDLILIDQLKAIGLVRRDENQKTIPLCKLYVEFFNNRL